MLKTNSIVLLFIVAVLTDFSHADGNYEIVVSEDGTVVEILDATEEPEDSESTPEELKADVIFNLHTISNPEISQIIYPDDDDTLLSSYFDISKPTRFIIHGWLSSAEKLVCTSIRDAYVTQGDYNVICVDWSAYAKYSYFYSRTKVVAVGKYLGLMIDYLVSQGMSIDDLIVTGHSLGAHIAGVGGRSATNTVPSIVALDPAGPLFYFVDTNARLRSTDANHVAVVHTNSALLGYNSALGDADFWPNGGDWQAGCDWDISGSCSHQRAYLFFAESIATTGDEFVAHSCGSYSNYKNLACAENDASYMGGASLDIDASGNYYLTTNSASPYAMG